MTGACAEDVYRPCAAVVLFDRGGRVLVGERVDVGGPAWQLPQGGVDDGETPRAAARRELMEEVSVRSAVFLAEDSRWHPYDVPESGGRPYRGRYRGQRLRFVAFLFTGDENEIDVATDHPEFRAWKWAELEELPGMIVAFKRPAYEAAVAGLRPVRDRVRAGAATGG
jgi:putative (di)nucleoside polyphosphate hydrolase